MTTTHADENQISKRQIARRWTPELAKNWTPVSNVFLDHYRDLDITPSEAMFIIILMSYKWDEQAPYPGFKELSKKMGVTVTAVRGYARSLDTDKHLLHREIRVDDTNIFHLKPLFTELEKRFKQVQEQEKLQKQQASLKRSKRRGSEPD